MEKVNVYFDQKSLEIVIETGNHYQYGLDLERANNSAELLDWIFQINYKAWATPEVMKKLLDEINKACLIVFDRSAQVTYCPSGVDKKVNWKAKLKK